MNTTNQLTDSPKNAFEPTGDQYEVGLGTGSRGQQLTGTVAGDWNPDGPSLWLITPPWNEAEGVGVGYELNEDEAVELASVIYASLTDAGRLRLVAALAKGN